MLILVTFLVVLFLYLFTRYYKLCNFWKNRGVKYLHPLPLIGNSLPSLIETVSLSEYIVNLYNEFPNERYCGIFQFEQPILLLKDPELIKKITIKDFDSFSDHSFMGEDIDSLWGKTLFASGGEKWKNLRHTLSPVFTSGKMKLMFHLIEQTTQQLIDYLDDQKEDTVEVELNQIIRKFASNAFASTAFGIEIKHTLEEDSEFYRMGIELTDWTGWRKFSLMVFNINPILAKILNIRIVSKKVGNFFSSIIKHTMDVRTKDNIFRPDLIHLLMEARKGKLKYDETNEFDGYSTAKETYVHKTTNKRFSMTDQDVYAQTITFFFGGFDTVSNSINFCIYELVANMETQEKLRREVDENVGKYGGKITYETLLKMKYLDMVVSETIRKWSLIFVDRKTVKPFTIEPKTEQEVPVHLQFGDTCWIPIFAIHRDPKYWPNPDVFDPERFSEENRHRIRSGTYMPFGIGPRNCIGSRYALLIMKMLLFYVIANFEVVPTSKTKIPLVLCKDSFFVKPKDGFWFGFKQRNVSGRIN